MLPHPVDRRSLLCHAPCALVCVCVQRCCRASAVVRSAVAAGWSAWPRAPRPTSGASAPATGATSRPSRRACCRPSSTPAARWSASARPASRTSSTDRAARGHGPSVSPIWISCLRAPRTVSCDRTSAVTYTRATGCDGSYGRFVSRRSPGYVYRHECDWWNFCGASGLCESFFIHWWTVKRNRGISDVTRFTVLRDHAIALHCFIINYRTWYHIVLRVTGHRVRRWS